MSLEIKGRIAKVLNTESGTSKAGKHWEKGGFVLDTGADYNPEVCFGCFGDKGMALVSTIKEGQEVNVSFNVSSREYNGKYYTQVDAWKVDLLSGNLEQQAADIVERADLGADDDGLPF